MELLYQSNPTLIPMRGFDMEIYINQHYQQEQEPEVDDDDYNNIVEISNDINMHSAPSKMLIDCNKYKNSMDDYVVDDVVVAGNVGTVNGEVKNGNITPAPSNAINGMNAMKNIKLTPRDSTYDDEDDDANMVYMVNEDEIMIENRNSNTMTASNNNNKNSNKNTLTDIPIDNEQLHKSSYTENP